MTEDENVIEVEEIDIYEGMLRKNEICTVCYANNSIGDKIDSDMLELFPSGWTVKKDHYNILIPGASKAISKIREKYSNKVCFSYYADMYKLHLCSECILRLYNIIKKVEATME